MEEHDVKSVLFDQLLERSDYLVIQAPLTSDTDDLFDESRLRRMNRQRS